MLRLVFLVLFSTTLLTACKKNSAEPVIPSGTYSGTFQRQSGSGGQISNITLTFSGDKWTGQSQFEKYPALCRGTFTTTGGEIVFKNDCYWTAEFDWSLVLGATYTIKAIGNGIEFSKDYDAGFRDVYKLTRQ